MATKLQLILLLLSSIWLLDRAAGTGNQPSPFQHWTSIFLLKNGAAAAGLKFRTSSTVRPSRSPPESAIASQSISNGGAGNNSPPNVNHIKNTDYDKQKLTEGDEERRGFPAKKTGGFKLPWVGKDAYTTLDKIKWHGPPDWRKGLGRDRLRQLIGNVDASEVYYATDKLLILKGGPLRSPIESEENVVDSRSKLHKEKANIPWKH